MAVKPGAVLSVVSNPISLMDVLRRYADIYGILMSRTAVVPGPGPITPTPSSSQTTRRSSRQLSAAATATATTASSSRRRGGRGGRGGRRIQRTATTTGVVHQPLTPGAEFESLLEIARALSPRGHQARRASLFLELAALDTVDGESEEEDEEEEEEDEDE